MSRYLFVDPSNALGALRGFGQSAPASEAVSKLQRKLKDYALWSGNIDYDPGQVDGLYGKNTHAAVLRYARDVLEPVMFSTPEMFSTCCTLWLRAKGACQDYLGTMLRGINSTMDGSSQSLPALTTAEIAEVQIAYTQWLDAYVTEYGDGGELDPLQIARREEVPIAEAEVIASERAAEADRVAEADLDDQTEIETQTAADAAAVVRPRLAGWKGVAAVVLVLALGGVLVKMYLDDKKKRKSSRTDRNIGRRFANRRG